jgi:hypothetical protein
MTGSPSHRVKVGRCQNHVIRISTAAVVFDACTFIKTIL